MEQNTSDSTDAKGWQRLTTTVEIKRKIQGSELAVYVYYIGADSAYFDDFEVKYLHR